MRKYNRFTRGRSTFVCESCGHRTRDTGQGVDHLCMDCYNLASIENHCADNGLDSAVTNYGAEVLACYKRIIARGGKYGFWTELGPWVEKQVPTVKIGLTVAEKKTGKRWCVTSIGPKWIGLTSYASGVQCALDTADFHKQFNLGVK